MSVPTSAASSPSAPSVADCEARFAAAPEADDSSYCFVEAAAADPGRRAEAVRSTEALLRRQPGNAWLSYFLGSLLWQEPRRSSDLFAAAADRLAERGLPQGEVRACANLYYKLLEQDRQREAEAAVKRAVRVADASGDPLAVARARILESSFLTGRDQDLPRAYRLLLDAREIVTPGAGLPHPSSRAEAQFIYTLRRDSLSNMSLLGVSLGRLGEARRFAEEAVALTVREGDRSSEAVARYRLLRVIREQLYLLPVPGAKETALGIARETLAAAEAVGDRGTEASANGILGLLTSGSVSEDHFLRCREAAATRTEASYCRSQQARRLTADEPERAMHLVDEALDLAVEANDSSAVAYAWRERMRVSWRLGPPEQSIRDSMTALTSIELLRKLQAPGEGRAEVFALWASHYHWLTGRLLEETGNAADLDLAFEVQERMRARALVDALEAAQAGPAPSEDAPLATLARIRQSLEPDEALLSFQIANWKDMVGDFAGGSWLTVVTRGGVTVHPLRSSLAGRTELRSALDIFTGLFNGDGDNATAAATLYGALLADGLAGLDPGIRRLVIVPDDVLHRFPFAVLRSAPDAPPLAARYEIAMVPSATLWLHWRDESSVPAASAALVLADPESPEALPSAYRGASFLKMGGLGALPWARREGKSIVRHLGAGSRLLVGTEAAESLLKKDPGPYGILHFATHAWTDDSEPELSFVLLSPGSPAEDGFLQIREITRLNLRGRIAVLSTCSSASGEVLRGEGVMSLARAFFQAGAHTVVATLWPLQDDDGAALFDRFYEHLGQGLSVAAALRAAQLDRIAEGAFPAAWAGVIVLGDGDRIPMPGGRRGLPPLAVPAILTTATLLFAGAIAFLVRRTNKNSHKSIPNLP